MRALFKASFRVAGEKEEEERLIYCSVLRPAGEVARLHEHPPLRDINSAEGLMSIEPSLLFQSKC